MFPGFLEENKAFVKNQQMMGNLNIFVICHKNLCNHHFLSFFPDESKEGNTLKNIFPIPTLVFTVYGKM
jgi:hypothetical protein